MPHVSREPLSKKTWTKVWQQFVEVFRSAKQDQQLDQVLSKVLTQTEKVMLAKRMTMGILLTLGWHTNNIAQALHLSTSTIYQYQAKLTLDEEYAQFLQRFVQKNGLNNQNIRGNKNNFVTNIEELLEDLLTSYHHRSRAYYGRES